jgi:hypothetical protein
MAIAFLHSDKMIARKDEWELLVDKSLMSIQNVIPGIYMLVILFSF